MSGRNAHKTQYDTQNLRDTSTLETEYIEVKLEKIRDHQLGAHPPDTVSRKKRRLHQEEALDNVPKIHKLGMRNSGELQGNRSSSGKNLRTRNLQGLLHAQISSPASVTSDEDVPPPTPSPKKNAVGKCDGQLTENANHFQPQKKVTKGSTTNDEDPFDLSPNLFDSEGPPREAFSSPIRTQSPNSGLADCPSKPGFPGSKSTTSSPSKRANLTRRMMNRSKTEPSFPDHPEPSSSSMRLGPSSSLPTFASAFQTDYLFCEQDKDDAVISPPSRESALQEVSRRVPVHKHTYASTRSYLTPVAVLHVVNDPEAESDGDRFDELGAANNRESYADLTARWGLDIEESVHNEIVLKSISEMRSKGESRRYLDDMSWLAEGLEEDTSVACNSAIEILQKMCNPEFVQRAKAVDFLKRIWGLMMSHRCSGSKIMEAALVFLACLIARESSALNDFAHQIEDVLPFLSDMITLSPENDILKQISVSSSSKIKGYSKRDILSVQRLISIICRSEVHSLESEPSVSFLASMALKSICITTSQDAERLLSSVLIALSRALQPLLGSTNDEERIEIVKERQRIDHLMNCTSLLDSSMASLDSPSTTLNDQVDEHVSSMMKGLITLCSIIYSARNKDIEVSDPLVPLRVLVNLSTSGQKWTVAAMTSLSDIFSLLYSYYRDYGHQALLNPEAEDSLVFDHFSLALALITNIVKEHPEAKNAVRELTASYIHAGCPHACTYSDVQKPIPFLVTVYQTHSARLENKTTLEDAYLTGHLATLLALLCIDYPPNLSTLLNVLPGKTPYSKLDGVLQNVESFAASYDVILNHLSQTPRMSKPPQAEAGQPNVDVSFDNFTLDISRQLRLLRNSVAL